MSYNQEPIQAHNGRDYIGQWAEKDPKKRPIGFQEYLKSLDDDKIFRTSTPNYLEKTSPSMNFRMPYSGNRNGNIDNILGGSKSAMNNRGYGGNSAISITYHAADGTTYMMSAIMPKEKKADTLYSMLCGLYSTMMAEGKGQYSSGRIGGRGEYSGGAGKGYSSNAGGSKGYAGGKGGK